VVSKDDLDDDAPSLARNLVGKTKVLWMEKALEHTNENEI